MCPSRQSRLGDQPALQGQIERTPGIMGIRRIKNTVYLAGHLGATIDRDNVALDVVLQMELATMPHHAGKHRPASRPELGMIVIGDEPDAPQATRDRAMEKLPPMRSSSDRATETPSIRLKM